MDFKLILRGYQDGNSIQEVSKIVESVGISFEKIRPITETATIEETVNVFVNIIELLTLKSVEEIASIEEQPVARIVSHKFALKQNTGFTHFPTYYIAEQNIKYSTITFDNEIVMFEGTFLVSQACSLNPLVTTSYKYVEDGTVPVEVNYVEGVLSKLGYTDNEKVHEASFPWLSQRKNIHQINKDPIPYQGEIGATASDRCLQFGVIMHDKQMEFTITSGEPYDLRVTDLIVPSWLGIELHNIHIGTILPAGGSLTFIIYAFSNLGRKDVRDFFTIKFDEVVPRFGCFQRVSICVDIHRRQSPDILIIPDKGSYSESIEYKTIEFQSMNNIHHTKPMMVNFKYSCKYSVTMHKTDYHKSFINILKSGKRVVIQHPLWSQTTVLNYDMENSTYCKCDTSGCDFREGEWAFVYVDVDKYYLRQIAQIVSEGLIFTRNVVANKGAFVIPAFPAMVKGTINTTYIGEQYIKGDVEFIEFREGEYYVYS
jgi:hypothetical protein